MRLIITRHGETDENKTKVIQGHFDGKLSEKGREQAKKLAKKLSNEKIDLILSSDLSRARDTAKEILKYQNKAKLILDQRLRERHLGKLQGKSAPAEWKEKKWSREFEQKYNLENSNSFFSRSYLSVKELIPKNFGKTILVVSHNGTCKAIVNLPIAASCGASKFMKC